MSAEEHILIVDDDPNISDILKRLLVREGYRVSVAANADEMRQCVEKDKFQLIILDLMLPDSDGLTLAREVCSGIDSGLIMLTGKSDVVDKIVGLEVGADDYITKPFDDKELLARVRSVLRRTAQTREKTTGANDSIAHFNGWKLDLTAQELTSPDNESVRLTSHEYQLLSLFVNNPNKVFSRDKIMSDMTDRDWSPVDRSIDVLVSKLRAKLKEDTHNPSLIKTIRSAGYKLTAHVNFD